MKNIFNKFAFFIALSFVFISCGNLATSENDDSIPQGKGKITISTDLQNGRSVLPTAIKDTTTGLKWELVGTKDGAQQIIKSWTDFTDEAGTVTVTAYKSMTSDLEIFIDTGTWDFTLTASLTASQNNVTEELNVLQAHCNSVQINAGNNALNFVMQEATEKAASSSIEFTLNFPKDVVDNVEAKLFKYENNDTEISNQTLSIDSSSTDNYSSVKYSYPDATGTTSSPLSAGYYILKIELQQDISVQATATDYQPINTYSCLIRVAPGLLSQGKYTLTDLAQLYTINYKLEGGYFIDSATTTSYNAYTSFALPEPTYRGYEFAGWYTQESNEDNIITEELFGNAGETTTISEDITLYAKWKISWDGLKNQIESDSGISEFVITEDLTATSTITVSKPFKITSDKNVTITRGNTTGNTSFTDAFFKVESAGNLELEGKENSTITLDGGKANESPILATAPLITSSGNLTLTNCTLQNNKNTSTTPGGAIYISAGKFTMNGGIIGKKITGSDASTEKQSWQDAATDSDFSNYAYAGGGGIYVASGDVTINGGKISYNYTRNPETDCQGKTPENTAAGGGISIVSGSLSLINSEVSYNSGYQGGGIRCYNDNTSNAGTLTLNKTLIKGNTSNPYKGSSFGGGLMVKNFKVTFEETTESTIEQNYSGDGGALFLENTTSTLTNITIQNNSYNSKGYHYGSEVLLWANANVLIDDSNVSIASTEVETRGIFIYNNTNTLKLSGGAKLDAPVYLMSGTTVTVAGYLTSNTPPVATITPEKYEESTPVITAADSNIYLADLVGKFALTDTDYKISDDGKVVSKSGGGGTVNPDVTVTSWSTLKSTIESINTTYTEENPYVIEITSDITTSADTAAEITVSSHVKLVSNTNCIITRTSDFAGVNLFQVNTEASLTIGDANAGGTLTLDGGGTDVSATTSLVNVSGTLVLNEKSVLQNNNCPDSFATSGAAVYSSGGTLKVFGSTIKNNSNNHSSNFGGAIYIKKGTLNITSGTFEENKTNKNGGAIYVTEGTVNITGGNFINNKVSTGSNKTETSYGGGAIYIDSAETSISAATFESNITEDGVGTLLITNIGTETSPAMIYNCTFTNNTAYQNGAAIYTGGNSYIEINNCTFTDNTLSNVESHDVYIGNTGGTTKINGSAMTGAWTSSSN